ncbi:MAG: L-rhamnose/proton symporter RhaT [Ichthyobacteriaceae bacterium]|nr:L-rhamnose/proton symporter RhaT [Ichthyobacteriaceae bacterium]
MGGLIGILLHSIGGFAAGSFYIPMNMVRKWSWESAWMILGIAAWIVTPITVAYITVPELLSILFDSVSSAHYWTFFWGAMWGIGGLTFGLAMRYLGISLGMTIALGFCTAFGTLIPPIFEGTFIALASTTGGQITLFGVLLSLVGIGITGRAGFLKEKDLDKEAQQETVKEFNLSKGMIVAVISGILSAGFAFGLTAGKPIAETALAYGTEMIFQNNAVLVWVLWGGFVSNIVYVVFMLSKNKTYTDFKKTDIPISKNYMWTIIGGVTWYMQFFFYGMGSTFLGEEYEFASWSLHMASIIFFSNAWGLYFKEWKGISKKTRLTLYSGLSIIVISFLIIGLGGGIH